MRAGGLPRFSVTSRTGLPEISTSLPPTWNDPMPRKVIGSSADAVLIDAANKIASQAARILSSQGFR
jgi:hypothetical protein